MSRQSDSDDALLYFSVGSALYSLPISEIEQLVSVAARDVYRLPFVQSDAVRGMFSFRGAVVAIAGFPEWDVASVPPRDPLTLVLARNGEKRFAVSVDEIVSVSDLPDGSAPTALHAASLYGGRLS